MDTPTAPPMAGPITDFEDAAGSPVADIKFDDGVGTKGDVVAF